MHQIWVFVTDCGDSAVTLPLALLVLIVCRTAGQPRVSLVWFFTIAGAAVAIAALKVLFGACSQELSGGHIVSPSGHTAMSTAVYGALAILVAARLPEAQRYAIYATAALGIAGIALSRVVLHEHNPAEVVVGWVAGAAAVALFAVALRRREAPPLPLVWLLFAAIALVAVMHGTRWVFEPAVHRLAGVFRLALPFCR